MGGLSLVHWSVVLVVTLLLIGKGRFSNAMHDVGGGLLGFRKALTEDKAALAAADEIEPKPAGMRNTATDGIRGYD